MVALDQYDDSSLENQFYQTLHSMLVLALQSSLAFLAVYDDSSSLGQIC
jgi:hypothetical protein